MTRREAITGGASLAAIGAPKAGDDWKAFDGHTGREVRWRDLPGRLADADAVFVGEQHDDAETHRVEAALLEAVHGKVGPRLTLAMEMFERDGQAALSEYLAGKTDEAALGRAVRLWPNYATDYRPMVEYAKARGIPVLASNAPQRIVRQVGKEGMGVLAKLPDADRPFVAKYVLAPEGDVYATRFAAVMGQGHGSDSKMEPEMVRRFYEAQCLRDDTMGETVADALAAGRFVFHVNGSFHSDAGLGTAARTLWRRPVGTVLRVLKVVPMKGTPEPGKLKGEADYLIFVPDRREAKKS